jgi:hypothetical protein
MESKATNGGIELAGGSLEYGGQPEGLELPRFAGRDEIDYLTIVSSIHAEIGSINR